MVEYIASKHKTSKLDRANLLIAHEVSHTWFGNRVTPIWWDDLWLNEAFASYFQFIITAKVKFFHNNKNDYKHFDHTSKYPMTKYLSGQARASSCRPSTMIYRGSRNEVVEYFVSDELPFG